HSRRSARMASLYLDHGVAIAVTPPLLAAGHDVVIARRVVPRTAGDDLHLLTATHLGRILVTYDADFILLHNAWRRWSRDWGISRLHTGILLTPQPPFAPPQKGRTRCSLSWQRGACSRTNCTGGQRRAGGCIIPIHSATCGAGREDFLRLTSCYVRRVGMAPMSTAIHLLDVVALGGSAATRVVPRAG